MHEVHAPRARSFAELPDQDGYIFFPPVGGAPRLHHHPDWNEQHHSCRRFDRQVRSMTHQIFG